MTQHTKPIRIPLLDAMRGLALARWLLVRWPIWSWLLLALIVWCLPWGAAQAHAVWPSLEFLNHRDWNWLGLISRKPITEDYVPLAPWLGVMLLGMTAARLVLHRQPPWMTRPLPTVWQPLSWLGRHSLAFYLLHQPVLFGVLLAFKAWVS